MKCKNRIALRSLKGDSVKETLAIILNKAVKWNKDGRICLTFSGSGERVFFSAGKDKIRKNELQAALLQYAFKRGDGNLIDEPELEMTSFNLRGSLLQL